MNWEALGAIAEALGAAGVIGTLVYLSIQIRQNTAATRSSEAAFRTQTEAQLNARFHEARRDVYADPELASLVRSGLLEPDSLDAEQWMRFHLYFLSVFLTLSEMYRQNEDLLVDRTEVGEIAYRDLFRYPGIRAFWRDDLGYDFEWNRYVQAIFENTSVESEQQLRANPSPWWPIERRTAG